MDLRKLDEKIESVRMMAGRNQFTIEGCGWLAEICKLAKVNQESIVTEALSLAKKWSKEQRRKP